MSSSMVTGPPPLIQPSNKKNNIAQQSISIHEACETLRGHGCGTIPIMNRFSEI